MTRVITFKADEALLEALDEYARSRRLSRSEVIRRAIEELLRREGIEVKKAPRKRRIPPPRWWLEFSRLKN